MTLTFGFYNSVDNDRQYNAEQMSSLFDGIITDGVFSSIGSRFAVTRGFIFDYEPSYLTVIVAAGRAWFNHTWTNNDAPIVLNVDPADLILNRIDTVILEVDTSIPVRANSIKIIKGTPATNPAPPTLTNSGTMHQYALANIAMDVGTTIIGSDDITNLVGTAACPLILGTLNAHFAPLKATLNDSDEIAINDVEDSYIFKRIYWATVKSNIKLFLDNYFGDIENLPHVAEGRLTATSGVPITTSDVASSINLYYTPYVGNKIACWDGSKWVLREFTEITLSLSGVLANTNYDIFYVNDTVPALSALAWTNDTTRVALAVQDGILVRGGAPHHRYIGTIRAGSGICIDTEAKRFIWNMYNRVDRPLRKTEGTSNWSYQSTTIRPANGSTANRVEIVVGNAGAELDLSSLEIAGSGGGNIAFFNGIGEDSTTTPATGLIGGAGAVIVNQFTSIVSRLTKHPTIGYHYYQWIEQGSNTYNLVMYGNAAGANLGLVGKIRG